MNEPTSRKCPRCTQTVEPVAISCPFCGFARESAQLLYGTDPVTEDRVMDPAGRLPAGPRGELQEALDRFGEVFPQLGLRMWLGNLPVPASPRQFVFWLLNQPLSGGSEAGSAGERSLLLAIDPDGGTAVLGCGYVVEAFVTEAELDSILAGALHEIRSEDYAGAVNRITSGLSHLLRRFALEPEKPCGPDAVPSETASSDAVEEAAVAGGAPQTSRTLETAAAASGPDRVRTSRGQSPAPQDNPMDR